MHGMEIKKIELNSAWYYFRSRQNSENT